MDSEDLEPKKQALDYAIGTDLSTLSLGELEDLITKLEAEISRIRQILAEKSASREAADSVFKR